MPTTREISISFVRHLARWRAEYLQRTAWNMHNNEATWETARIERYARPDGRSGFLRRSPASPRVLYIPSHVNCDLPSIETNVFTWPAETLTLTEQNLENAERVMLEHDPAVLQAWRTYLAEPEPIKVWSVIERDGIRPGFRTKIRPLLPAATLALTLPTLEWNTGREWKLEELVGR